MGVVHIQATHSESDLAPLCPSVLFRVNSSWLSLIQKL